MEWILLILVIIIIGFIILAAKMNQEQKDFEDNSLKDISEKGMSLTKQTKCYDGIIGIDEPNKKLVFISSSVANQKAEIFNFADIHSCELLIDDQSVYKKSASRTVGGALIGGALFGGAGALVGGLSGNSKKSSNIKKIELKIVVRDLSNPAHKFTFYGSTTPAQFLDNKKEEAESWKDTISLIIDMEDKKNI